MRDQSLYSRPLLILLNSQLRFLLYTSIMYQWLQISGGPNSWVLTDYRQFQRLINGLRSPSQQRPVLTCFVGDAVKSQALRAIFPHNNTQRRSHPCIAKLHISTYTAEAENPTLIIDTNLGATENPKKNETRQLRSTSFQIRCEEQTTYSCLRERIFVELLFPFSQIIYLFVDDIGGPERTEKLLIA